MSEYGLRQQDYETIKTLKQELSDLRARLEKAEKDAERYQFLRFADLDTLADDSWGRDGEVWTGDKFDAAIDAAIKAQQAAETARKTAQGPAYWVYTINGSHTVGSVEKPPEDAYDEGTLHPLYDHAAPCARCTELEAKITEQAAEIERERAARRTAQVVDSVS